MTVFHLYDYESRQEPSEGNAMPVISEIQVPTESDLQPLYDAARAYGEVSEADWDRWSKVKEETGGDWKAAYADPEVKRLKKKEDALRVPMDRACDEINRRFPGLGLAKPGPWMMIRADVSGYKRCVREYIADFVRKSWHEANRDEIEAARETQRKFPVASNPLTGSLLCHCKHSTICRIIKTTHGGKRIKAINVLTNKEIGIKADNLMKYQAVDEVFFKRLQELHRSYQETLDRYVPQEREDGRDEVV